MTKPMVRIHDLATGEIVDREMNADEIKQMELDAANAKIKADAIAAKEATRNSALAKLAALGLTPEEISAIS
jgi:hypothetical protein